MGNRKAVVSATAKKIRIDNQTINMDNNTTNQNKFQYDYNLYLRKLLSSGICLSPVYGLQCCYLLAQEVSSSLYGRQDTLSKIRRCENDKS
jgi:hypothetical protein